MTENPEFVTVGEIKENKPFTLSCTVIFKAVPNWSPEVNISDGTRNIRASPTQTEGRTVVQARVPSPIDKQSYKCITSFASPPANAIPDDSLDSMHDRRPPLFKQEQDLVPYIKPS